MSTPETPSKGGATFLWVLGTFAVFAVLLSLIQSFVRQPDADPRAAERLASKEEILKAQADLTAKMGLDDLARREAVFARTVQEIKARKPAASAQVVPGSPTQLKQAAAAPAPAAPAAPPAPTAKPQ